MADFGREHGLMLRQDYFGDPSAWQALVDLLQDTFSIDVNLQASFGDPDPTSMPFGYFDSDGRCVANFTVFSMPMMINGRTVKAAGYQSGAVRPEWRGRGLYRDLMQRAFAWAIAEGFELDMLLTSKPVLYEGYGFKTVPQHVFVATKPKPVTSSTVARTLSLQATDDLRLMKALLERRKPVSRQFAVARQMEMFHLNACFDPAIQLTAISDDAIVVWTIDGNVFRLLDIAATAIPSLQTILSALDVEPARIEICFPPDLLDCGDIELEPYESSIPLMVRGKAANEITGPLMLSPMAEF
ncbi:GNAT family N-acetyltransferase [Rhizobium sp. P38BS-XIX]|uniref:GNAT family N-acetyltransferase n=1 Tax=Rhizobium sp. P38BS-XIX TaxID=2726740 RepID=UPI0014563678|nr:GNAT family N-acetyltransferase [Rhizobium sp. P38BS-XIX]NLR98703.1 GNAT family N-acetyltransferase [Rhizobium sp. P38BS-XIX]